MGKSLFHLLCRPTYWIACLSLLVLLAVLTACGADNANALPAAGTPGNTSSTSSNSDAKATVTAALTVTLKESIVAGKDRYSTSPATITVKKGDTITLQNATDDDQDFDQGDAAKAGVDVIIPANGVADVTFNVAGAFAIKSKLGAVLNVAVS